MRVGAPELVVVLIIALVIFGPGKLPELGKMLGKAIGSIKHYSDPATWEKQAEQEDNSLKMAEMEEKKAAASGQPSDGAAASVKKEDGPAAADKAYAASSGDAADGKEASEAEAGESELVLDIPPEMPEEDAAFYSGLEGKPIDEIASEVLKSGKEVDAE